MSTDTAKGKKEDNYIKIKEYSTKYGALENSIPKKRGDGIRFASDTAMETIMA